MTRTSFLGRFFVDERHQYGRYVLLVLSAAVLSRVFLAYAPQLIGLKGVLPYCQFDCGWYRSIVNDGYHVAPRFHDDGAAANWAFFPLFPLSIKFLMSILPKAQFVVYAATFNSILFVLSALLLFRINLKYDDIRHSALGVVAFCFFPATFYFFAAYTESLFLFLALCAILLLQQKHFISAGIIAALLSATRNQGVFFVFVILAYGIAELINRKDAQFIEKRNIVLDVGVSVMIAPTGLLLYGLYLYNLTGDALAFGHIVRAWGKNYLNPAALTFQIMRFGDTYNIFALFTLSLGGIAAAWLISTKRYGEAVFGILCLGLAAISGSFTSIPRYTLTSVIVALSFTHAVPKLPRLVFAVFIVSEIILLVAFANEWFRGAAWLV